METDVSFHVYDIDVDSSTLITIGAAVAVLLLLLIVWKILTRRRRPAPVQSPDLTIDLRSLGTAGPPPGEPVLEFYNLPVRLAAIVLAPAGRAHELPPQAELNRAVDMIVPGLGKVVAVHRPLARLWPAQVSVRGFAHSFFSHAQLPGDGGKGTPWSSMAGVFATKKERIMVGLVLRTEHENSFGQVIVDSEGKWLDCLRVKGV